MNLIYKKTQEYETTSSKSEILLPVLVVLSEDKTYFTVKLT